MYIFLFMFIYIYIYYIYITYIIYIYIYILEIISKNILLCGTEKYTSGMNKEILKCTITISFSK